jgi:hypothetical protein
MWTPCTYSYLATTSTNLTLQFTFQTNNKCTWYVDDVSVQDPTPTEMLTNGNFENSSSPTGWTTGSSATCASQYGITSTEYHSPSQCYYDKCDGETIWISQSFTAIGSQVYNITFWYYFTCSNGVGSNNPIEMDVTMN